MTQEALQASLSRIAEHTTPPAHIFREALKAYASHVEELEEEIARLNQRVTEEVQWQYSIRDQEKKHQAEQYERHQREKRELVKELGFAAKVYSRVTDARWHGRKTVKVDALLEGEPDRDAAA